MVIAPRRQRLWIFSVTGHTHRLGTQISEQFSGRMIGSLMLILPLQDWLITLAIPFHAAIPPSPLSTPALTIFWTPSTGTRLLLFIFSLHPSSRSLSLSLGLLCGYYNDRGDKGHLSHVRRGEQEKALNRSRGRITGTRTEKLSTRARTNARTHTLGRASTLAHLCRKTGR